MEFYERVSGARLHAAYVRPGGVAIVRSHYTENLSVISFVRCTLSCSSKYDVPIGLDTYLTCFVKFFFS